MISVKCKIKNEIQIDNYICQFNNVLRYAYNRFCDGLDFLSIYHKCNKELKNKDLLDASFVESAVNKAQWIFKTSGSGVIFGGKKNFFDVKYGKSDGSEFKENRNKWLLSVGRAGFKGNRKFNFDLDNNKVVFKPSRNVKIGIEFEPVGKNQRKLLSAAQILSQSKLCPITVSLSKDYIIFHIDEKIIQEKTARKSVKKGRILSLDSNPQFIGVVVSDYESETTKTTIHKEVIDLKLLSDVSTEKRYYEILSVAQRIAKLAKHYGCELVAYEDLTIKSRDHKKGTSFNRKVNNTWNRNKFFNNLKKWLNIYDVKHQEIAPQYSSFIGQMTNENEPDMIAAAMEIGRRAYIFNRVYLVKDKPKEEFSGGIIFPELSTVPLPTRWKEMVESKGWKTWNPFFGYIKKSKLSYRFLFRDWLIANHGSCFRHKSRKSNVFLCFC